VTSFPESDLSGTISRLFVYPVKSCAGVEVQEAVLTETGLDLDRAWMVVDAQGVFLTQRALPRMALIRPQLKTSEWCCAPRACWRCIWRGCGGGPGHRHGLEGHRACLGHGPGGCAMVQRFSGAALPSGAFDPHYRRLSSTEWTGVEAPTSFRRLSLAGDQRGIAGRAQWAPGQAAGQEPVGMERFRPNVVLAGVQAHDEDRVDMLRMAVGQQEVHCSPSSPVPRCPIPNIDPATAHSSPVVADTLQAYRQDPRVGMAPSPSA
jgi:hypothetical protein